MGKAIRDLHHDDATWTLKHYGFRWDSTPTNPQQPETAKADIVFQRNGLTGFIEVKTGHDQNLRFDSDETGWKPKQQAWAQSTLENFRTEYWLMVYYRLKPGRVLYPKLRVQRACFLVPYLEAVKARDLILPIQGSLPYRAEDAKLNVIKERSLDAQSLWKSFELPYLPGYWSVPENHPFYRMYIAAKPLPLYQEIADDVARPVELQSAS